MKSSFSCGRCTQDMVNKFGSSETFERKMDKRQELGLKYAGACSAILFGKRYMYNHFSLKYTHVYFVDWTDK